MQSGGFEGIGEAECGARARSGKASSTTIESKRAIPT